MGGVQANAAILERITTDIKGSSIPVLGPPDTTTVAGTFASAAIGAATTVSPTLVVGGIYKLIILITLVGTGGVSLKFPSAAANSIGPFLYPTNYVFEWTFKSNHTSMDIITGTTTTVFYALMRLK
jgi:hypothetical protein